MKPVLRNWPGWVRPWNCLLVGVAILPFFTCDTTTQSYNYGKILLPGVRQAGVGIGRRAYHQVDSVEKGSDTPKDTLIHMMDDWAFRAEYRLGVLSKIPFGKGLEIGISTEYPSQFRRYKGLPVLEFDARFGFRPVSLWNRLIHHNAAVGWAVGAWVDNGWFAEYALGLEFKYIIPYLNTRLGYKSTDITAQDVDLQSKTLLQNHDRSWNSRVATGLCLKLPSWPLLPERITPEASLVYPNYSFMRKAGLTYHVGLHWRGGN